MSSNPRSDTSLVLNKNNTLPPTIPIGPTSNIGINELTNCSFCHSPVKEGLTLPCVHTFCKACLHSKTIGGKLVCPICEKEHQVLNGDIEKAFKPSILMPFLLKIRHKQFDEIEITEEEKNEHDGICLECNPPVPDSKKKQKNEVNVEPLHVKLSTCFHCKKPLCQSCQTKHYNQERQASLDILNSYQTGSGNIVVTTEKLNQVRNQKIIDYTKLRIDINEKRLELVKRLEQEEQKLAEKIETEIALEQKNIQMGNNELSRMVGTRELTKSIKEKIASEKNTKRLSEMCQEFIKAQNEWKSQLESEATRVDPNKETKVVFTPSKLKDDLIGTLEQKKGNFKVQQASIPSSKSSVCSIL